MDVYDEVDRRETDAGKQNDRVKAVSSHSDISKLPLALQLYSLLSRTLLISYL